MAGPAGIRRAACIPPHHRTHGVAPEIGPNAFCTEEPRDWTGPRRLAVHATSFMGSKAIVTARQTWQVAMPTVRARPAPRSAGMRYALRDSSARLRPIRSSYCPRIAAARARVTSSGGWPTVTRDVLGSCCERASRDTIAHRSRNPPAHDCILETGPAQLLPAFCAPAPRATSHWSRYHSGSFLRPSAKRSMLASLPVRAGVGAQVRHAGGDSPASLRGYSSLARQAFWVALRLGAARLQRKTAAPMPRRRQGL